MQKEIRDVQQPLSTVDAEHRGTGPAISHTAQIHSAWKHSLLTLPAHTLLLTLPAHTQCSLPMLTFEFLFPDRSGSSAASSPKSRAGSLTKSPPCLNTWKPVLSTSWSTRLTRFVWPACASPKNRPGRAWCPRSGPDHGVDTLKDFYTTVPGISGFLKVGHYG